MATNMNEGRIISTHEATVRTVAVEMKTIMVSGKQVTMAVFRQLQLEPLLDGATAELKGLPWGRVNYFWGDCKFKEHLHVVWQKGDELRRACCWEERLNLHTLEEAYDEWLRRNNRLGPDDREKNARDFLNSQDYSSHLGCRPLAYVHLKAQRLMLDKYDSRLLKQILNYLCMVTEDYVQAEETWEQHWEELCALPQLFIAV